MTTDFSEPGLKLTEWTSCGGCAAKWGAAPLAGLVQALAAASGDASLLVGLAPFDDDAVYRLSDDAALVSTTDFFPPLVDDPADFGAIAAANACSDVFAMGGSVVRVWTKAGARPGDVLLLSKPLGTGILLAGGDPDDKAMAIVNMRRLNREAAEALSALAEAPHAVTDVTGFGMFGHAWEMAERSGARLEFDAASLPLYPGAEAAAERGVRTGGDARNRAHLQGRVTVEGAGAPAAVEALCYDPQTSGGLLAAVPPSMAADPGLAAAGFVPVGRVAEGPAGVRLS